VSEAHPAVSVIVPVYNRSRTVGEALASVLRQTFADFELIVVDDGSTEDLDAVLARFGDSRVRRLRHAHNAGTAAARNTGIRAARGSYIAFLDSDDMWLPTKLTRQLEWLRYAPADTPLCCTGYTIRRAPGDPGQVRQPAVARGSYRTLMWGCNLSPGSTALAKKSCFEEIGYFDESLGRFEDWDWLLRYAGRYEIGVVPAVLAAVRLIDAPEGKAVRASLDRLAAKHLPAARAHGWQAQRIFQAALALELAAQFYREDRLGRAMLGVMGSLACYPLRNLAFFRTMAVRLGSKIAHRLGSNCVAGLATHPAARRALKKTGRSRLRTRALPPISVFGKGATTLRTAADTVNRRRIRP